MLMIRKAFYHPTTATIDAEHDVETMRQPADQLEEDGPTKLDKIIKFIVILVMLIMAAFVIWNLHMFRNLPRGPYEAVNFNVQPIIKCEEVDHD